MALNIEAILGYQEIDEKIKTWRKEAEKEVKLLLLGTGNSGKSTVVKQMKIIHGDGFTTEERSVWIHRVHFHLISAAKAMLNAYSEKELGNDLPAFQLVAVKQLGDRLNMADGKTLVHAFKSYINHGVPEKLSVAFDGADSLKYFLTEMDRITDKEYSPNDEDIVRCRVMTTSVQELFFPLQGSLIRMVDVGGQKNERKKWIHQFDGVTSIIFVASLADYDMPDPEDPNKNALVDALETFEEVINNEYFLGTNIILFMNKYDVFVKKLKKSNLKDHFPEFKGAPNDPAAASDFVRDLFEARNKNKKRYIYPNQTTATDQGNMKYVIDAVKHTFLVQALHGL